MKATKEREEKLIISAWYELVSFTLYVCVCMCFLDISLVGEYL